MYAAKWDFMTAEWMFCNNDADYRSSRPSIVDGVVRDTNLDLFDAFTDVKSI